MIPSPEQRAKRTSRSYRLGLMGLTLVGATHVLLEQLEFSAYGSETSVLFAEGLSLLLLLFATLPVLLPLWIIVHLVSWAWKGWHCLTWQGAHWLIVYAVLSSLAFYAGHKVQRAGVAGIDERAQELCTAIDKYSHDTGFAPKALHELVPYYLESLPSTGVGRAPNFGYIRGEKAQQLLQCQWILYAEAGHLTCYASFYPKDQSIDEAMGEVEFGRRYGPEYGYKRP